MDFLQGLNPQQLEAVIATEGPVLILAGAGSGKTKVITQRIAHLITANHVPPSAILAVTFTNKAAGEMRERVGRLLDGYELSSSPQLATFHSFCVRLLRRDGDALGAIRPGFTRTFTIYDGDDQMSIVKSAHRRMGLDDKAMPPRSTLSAISHAKSQKIGPDEMASLARDPKATRVAAVYAEYEKILRQANALDFDDLLLETVRLLAHDADVREAWSRRLNYLMIDEYQDTNRSQYELMRLLSTKHDNVCVVGDEDQSIYSWRGADIRNILDFEKDYPRVKTIRLEQNYRSTKNILEAASTVIANNKERKGKWLWTEADEGDLISIYPAHDSENEALFIADTTDKILRQYPERRVAVLYRTNAQSRQIEEAMRRYNRKYNVVGGFSYYQRAEVKDIIAYLKLATSPQDSIALARIINVPARGIGRTSLDQVEQFASEKGIPLWEAIGRMLEENQFGTRAHAAFAAFRELMLDLQEAVQTKALNEAIGFIEERTGYRKMLETDNSPEAEGKVDNIDELRNAAAEAVERGETAADFLDHAALVADADGLDESALVTLMTIHNAKGLEFPVVFLAGMEENIFPHSRSIQNEAAMEEERRLCYVGMTRAEKRLIITWAKLRRRFGGGEQERSMKSRFLGELPANLTINLGVDDGDDDASMDLTAERWQVQRDARKNLYTGKSYNSVQNVQNFFKDRGGSGNLRPTSEAYTPPSPPRTSSYAPPAPPRPPVARPPTATQRPAEAMPWDDVPTISQDRPVPAPIRPAPPAAKQPTRPTQTSFSGNLFGDSPKSSAAATPPAAAPPRPSAGLPPRPPASPLARPLAPTGKRQNQTGTVVEHPKYGKGTIMRREGDGEDAKLVVMFQRFGMKKLVEKYAGLK
ncbi:MAG: ATP-dependent helicase, Rep family [Bryobacterales bacterium]|nr:ATP-dependent helicase, Rep family [Bryobacterales bacterium]